MATVADDDKDLRLHSQKLTVTRRCATNLNRTRCDGTNWPCAQPHVLHCMLLSPAGPLVTEGTTVRSTALLGCSCLDAIDAAFRANQSKILPATFLTQYSATESELPYHARNSYRASRGVALDGGGFVAEKMHSDDLALFKYRSGLPARLLFGHLSRASMLRVGRWKPERASTAMHDVQGIQSRMY